MAEPTLTGVHHIELTVRDADSSADWYRSVLGFTDSGRLDKEQMSVVMLRHSSGLLLGFAQHKTGAGDDFDERRTGLDHLAFDVGSHEAVDTWAARLDELGVAHSEVKSGALPGSRLIVFRDPDGIQLECYAIERQDS
jgi:glyoxylase I family protein